MLYLTLIVLLILIHLGLYAKCLRQKPSFRNEYIIFIYHLSSWLLCVTIFVMMGFISSGFQLAIMLAGLAGSVHGLYSLSFLELWSLSQGSYSLSILNDISRTPGIQPAFQSPEELVEIGRKKRTDRQLALNRLGLVDDQGKLTRMGQCSARAISLLIIISNGRSLNHR